MHKIERYVSEHIVGKSCTIDAVVVNVLKKSTTIPTIEVLFAGEYYSFPIFIKSISCRNRKLESGFYALVYIKKEIADKVRVSAFNLIRFKSQIHNPNDEEDSWKFQFRKFLYANGYTVYMIISNDRQLISCGVYETFNLQKLYLWIYDFIDRKPIIQKGRVNFIQALLFGATHKLSSKQREVYINSGTYHFFAVSGFSVMVLYIFISSLLRILLIGVKVANLVCILIIWFYIFFCGFSPSASRAGIIVSMFLLSNILYRKENYIHSLLLSFIFILTFGNPYALFDISFQYSFVIYSAILFVLPYTQEVVCKHYIYNIFGREKLFGKVLSSITAYLVTTTLITLVASVSILPLTIRYFGLGKVLFFDNVVANCISSIFFSIYFIVSLIFLLLLLILGNLPQFLWYIFSGVDILESILSIFTKNTVYFGTPYYVTIYIFYTILSLMALLIYLEKINLFRTVIVLLFLYFSFSFFSYYPARYTNKSFYSVSCSNSTIYYYIPTKYEIVVYPTGRFNKQVYYTTLNFLRYIRFLNGRVTFLLPPNTIPDNSLIFKNFSISFKRIGGYDHSDISIRKMKATKRLENIFISGGDISILYLQSVNKKWFTTFVKDKKVDIIEIASKARKSSIGDVLCYASSLIVNRSNKFTLDCKATKVFNTLKTIDINRIVTYQSGY